MNIRVRFPYSLSALLVLFIALSTPAAGEELPVRLQKEIELGKARLGEELGSAKEVLLSSFDKQIENSRSSPRLSPEQRLELIDVLEAEKAFFEKLEQIPMCSAMRGETIEYLNRIQKAENALAKSYDRAIEFQTKKKNDDAARTLVAEKKLAIEPKAVAKWQIIDTTGKKGGIWTLWSNGSVIQQDRRHTWTLDDRELKIKWKAAGAPPKYWSDRLVCRPDLMAADIINDKGDSIGVAKRIVDE